jgi:hypothetical protein
MLLAASGTGKISLLEVPTLLQRNLGVRTAFYPN